MISNQELSSQQVCLYFMDFQDQFTNHRYNKLYWTKFEKFTDDEDPSDKCYQSAPVPQAIPNCNLEDLDNNLNNETDFECSDEPDSSENYSINNGFSGDGFRALDLDVDF